MNEKGTQKLYDIRQKSNCRTAMNGMKNLLKTCMTDGNCHTDGLKANCWTRRTDKIFELSDRRTKKLTAKQTDGQKINFRTNGRNKKETAGRTHTQTKNTLQDVRTDRQRISCRTKK